MSQPESLVLEAFADVRAAQGLAPVDLLLKNCRMVNVCSREIYAADIAIRGPKIVAVRENFNGKALRTIDCAATYAVPGLVQFDLGSNPTSSGLVSTWIVAHGFDRDAPTAPRHSRRICLSPDSQRLAELRLCETVDDAISSIRSGTTAFFATQAYTSLAGLLADLRGQRIDTSRICFRVSEAEELSCFIHAALEYSFTPAEIFQMLSLNPARHFALDHVIGSIAPARKADILLTRSLNPFRPVSIIFDGQLLCHEGRPCD